MYFFCKLCLYLYLYSYLYLYYRYLYFASCVVLCRAFPYLHFGKKGGGSICADLPARMVGERPNGAQRRLLGHADVPSCGTPMLSDRCSLNIRKKAISVHFCSLSLSRNIERYEFLVKHSILAPTTRSAAGFKYGFLFSTCWPPNF